MILVMAGSLAQAATVTRNVTLCIDYDVEFSDNGNEDFWADNAVDRPARGVQIRVTDTYQSQVLYVSDVTGCANVNVEFTLGDKPKLFTVGVASRARVKGFDYEVHAYDNPVNPNVQPILVEEYTVSANLSQITVRTSSSIDWQVMATASWIFFRSRFNYTSGVSRLCCLEPQGFADPDGICNQPYRMYPGPNTSPLHYYVNTQTNGCPGGGGNNFNGLLNSVILNSACPSKWLIAHETGHAVVGMRMGGFEDGWDLNAPLDSCMGDYWPGGSPVDSPGASERGILTKEFTSQSFREGWAEFFAAWAWNSRVQSDCTYVTRGHYSDIDLDGTLDNDFTSPTPYNDFELDCAGDPFMGSNNSPFTDGVNWLDDLEHANDPAGCARSTQYINGKELEYNRSTVWDVTRMFWDLTSASTNAIGPAKLADLYVDMCPRGWSANDTEWTQAGGLPSHPIERLFDSAAHHSTIQTEVDDAANQHLVH